MVGLTKKSASSGGGGKKKKTATPGIFSKIASINLDPSVIFQKKRAPPCPRSVYFNEPLPPEAFDKKGKPLRGKKGDANWTFATNQVLTAKYTVFNFIFKNLLEQFRRVANLFFLLLVILQFFPKFSTISPALAMLPLLAVLAITALKDGYEDVKRHQSDRSINRLRVRTLTGGGWTNPNVMEAKERSLSSFVRSFYNQRLGGKKRQSKHVAAAHAQQPSAPAVEGVDPMPPPVDAPGGGSAPPLLNRAMTSRSSLGGGAHLRRQSSIGSLFGGGDYERGADGRIHHRGRVLSAEEEAKYLAKHAPRWKRKMWEDLAVGDFVLLKNNEAVPADIVVCATSEEEDACFVETKNLDGETNLKSRHAVPELAQAIRTAEDCTRILMRVDGEPLDTNMYRLNASVVLGERFDRDGQPVRCPVTLNQCLLRGCNVRNTEWIIGLVLMTGSDTKIIANSGNTPSKRGKVEKQMNPMVYFNLALLAIVAISCAIADSRIEHYYFDRAAYWEYLAIFSDDNPDLNGLTSFGNALITFQNIVPISLYISIEVVRTVQAYFIFDDYDIFYEPTMRRTTARSWNLSDDLGQIQYVFSDKTGTLTQNLMIFRELAVGGVTYTGDEASDATSENEKTKEFNSSASGTSSEADPRRKRVKPSTEGVPPFRDQRLIDALKDEKSKHAQEQGRFWRCLALCHTVLTSEDGESGMLEYKAQSPDEQALVQAAADVGFTFCGKDRQTLKIQTPWSLEMENYELLTVLEFSSARKRMSVILRRESDKRVIIYSKGADSVMFERSASGQDQLKADTDAALEEFANKGLRTLCLGYKEVDESVYEEWAHRYHDASVQLTYREEKMEELASELESDYILLGATAIEDRLQDGVPETIADLKRAGINVWVATGDKLETAIAIGYSTMLLSKEMNLIVVRGGEYGQPNSAYEQLKKAIERFFGGPDVVEQMEHQPPDVEAEAGGRRTSRLGRRPSGLGRRSQASATSLVGEDNGERPGGFALVIDGAALNHALTEEFSKELLLTLSTQCKAVICCRVSPLQKALIVRLIKDGLGVMTLAIGDGANDVSMIQAAHVGIGIAGEEGLQAVNSSDYAIAQFRYLKRLLLVHGHWSYYRNGTMILNFFYKEMINVGYLFWFQIYCAWSTTQAVDYVYLLFWNAFWTVALVIALGIFDRPISDRVLMEVPELYKRGREGRYFGLKPFLWYLLDGLYQATVLYFFISYSYDMTTARADGFDIQLYEWSTTMAIASVLIANLYTALWCKAWTWWLFAGLWIGPVLIFVFAPIYAAFSPQTIWTYSYGNNHYLYPSATFWFTGILCVALCLTPLFIFRHLRETYYPRDMDILRAVDKYDPKHDYVRDPRMPAMRVAKEYGLPISAFAGEPSTADEAGLTAPNRQATFAMHDLQPVSSRTSTHHDMLTGEDRPSRGFGFASDEPQRDRTSAKRRSFKQRFLPGTLRKKRKQSKLSQMAPREEDDEGVAETTADTAAPLNHPGLEDEEEDEENEPLPEQSSHTAPTRR